MGRGIGAVSTGLTTLITGPYVTDCCWAEATGRCAVGSPPCCNLDPTGGAAFTILHAIIRASSQSDIHTFPGLQGGAKVLPRLLRVYAADALVISQASRVLCKCLASSAPTLQHLTKEKGLGAILLTAASAHCRDPSVMAPLAELLVLVARQSKGALQLAGDTLVALIKDLLVSHLVSRARQQEAAGWCH